MGNKKTEATKRCWRNRKFRALREIKYCWKCEGEVYAHNFTWEHIIPARCGGNKSVLNLTIAHEECNRARGGEAFPPGTRVKTLLGWVRVK